MLQRWLSLSVATSLRPICIPLLNLKLEICMDTPLVYLYIRPMLLEAHLQ